MIKKILFVCLSISAAGMLGNQVQAATFTQTLNYNSSNQSIWGPGGSAAGFDFTESVSVDIPLGLGSVSVGYSVGANSGTVSANFNGVMEVDFMDSIAAPGITSLDLSYAGTFPFNLPPLFCPGSLCVPAINIVGGTLTSDFGANAQLTSSLGNVGPDFTLSIDETFLPQLGTTVNSSASTTAANLTLIDVLLADAGVNIDVTQTSSFVANTIDGSLLYSLQGSGVINSTPFSLGDLGANLDVDLSESGIWDFWFEDQTLENLYSTSFGLDFEVNAWTAGGCGFLGTSSCNSSLTLVSLGEIFGVSPFALDFNSITNMNGFSIEVGGLPSAVPVPAAAWLFGTALIGLVGFSKRRKAA